MKHLPVSPEIIEEFRTNAWEGKNGPAMSWLVCDSHEALRSQVARVTAYIDGIEVVATLAEREGMKKNATVLRSWAAELRELLVLPESAAARVASPQGVR